MSLELSNAKDDDKRPAYVENHNKWIKRVRKVYDAFLFDEMVVDTAATSREIVNQVWLNEMKMPPLLTCYKKQVHVFNIE